MNVMKAATKIVSIQHFLRQLTQRVSQAFPSANCESYELPSCWEARIKGENASGTSFYGVKTSVKRGE